MLRFRFISEWLVVLSFIVFRPGMTAAPDVIPVNGQEQLAVAPNTFVISFNVIPSVPSANITWLFGNTIITGAEPFLSLSVDRLSLTIRPVTSSSEGVYRLIATNGSSDEGQGSVALSVESKPAFQTLPDSAQVHERLNVTFDCFATGVPTPTITWLFNDDIAIDPNGGNKYFIGPFGNKDYGSLTVYNLEYSDAGTYTCVANNTHGSLSLSVTLEVQVFPVITVDPPASNITAGSVDTINCTARGFPFTDIYWQRNGVNITDIPSSIVSYTQTLSQPNVTDLTVKGTLHISGPVLSTEGNFSCIAKNILVTFEEAFSEVVDVFVQYPPSTESISMVIVNQSDSATLNCSSFGIPPPNIKWYSSLDLTTPIVSSDTITIEYSSYTNDSNLQIQTSSLTIPVTNRSLHEAQYICSADNGIENFIGTPESSATSLTVQVPPFVVFPVGENVLGIVTNSIVLSIVIENASPSVQPMNIVWTFQNSTNNNVVIVNGGQYLFSSNRLQLTINDLTHDNEGQYVVMATNEAGSHFTQLMLNIEAAPNITVFPMDTNVLMGYDESFHCGATSEPSHTVTWLKGTATTITNDTAKYVIREMYDDLSREKISVLTIMNTVMNDTDDYTCVVSNIHGSQNRSAYLDVQVPPVLLTVLNSVITGTVDGSISISCEYFGSPVPSVLWLKDSIPVNLSHPFISVNTNMQGFIMTSTLILSRLDFFSNGQYVCQGRNFLVGLQTTNSSDISVVVNQSPQFLGGNDANIVVVNQSQSTNLTCVFLSRPIPNITWTAQTTLSLTPTNITDDNVKYNIFTFNEVRVDGVSIVTTSILEINNLETNDTKNYTCTATNTPLTALESTSNLQPVLVQTSPIVTRVSNAVEIGVKSRSIVLSFVVSRDVPVVDPVTEVTWTLTRGDGEVETLSEDSRHMFDQSRTYLNITDLTLDDQGTYTLTAVNIIGNGSNTVFLDVQRSPMITNNSGIVRQVLGEDAILKCVAVSEPVHISRWLFEGTELTNDGNKYLIQGSGTTTSNLTIYNVTSADEGDYICQVDNAHGVDEESAMLLVQVPPSIVKVPVDTNVRVTHTVTQTCCVIGTPPPTISWLKDSQLVFNTSTITVSQDGACGTLIIMNTSLVDTATYQCQANNSLATELSVISGPANIVVEYPPDVFPLDQVSFTRNKSDSFSVECQAFGVPLPTIYWVASPMKQVMSTPEDQLLSRQQVQDLLSTLSPTSRLLNTSAQCLGNSSDNNNYISMDDACSYDVGVVNNCSLTNSLCSVPCVVDISSNSSVTDSKGRTIVSSRLRICSLLKEDELTYTCIAVNDDISNIINTPEGVYFNLIIQVPPKVVAIETDDPVTAFRDRNVSLDFVINNASPMVTPDNIVWRFNDVPLSSDSSHYDFSSDRRSVKIVGLTTADSGVYTLTATNPAGISSESITLDVQALPDIERVSSAKNVRSNGNITLVCYADGSPLQDVTWTLTDLARGQQLYSIQYLITNHANKTGFIKYTPLIDDISMQFLESKFTIASPQSGSERYGELTITDITPFEAGDYNCTLTNIFGVESRIIPVRVQSNPEIAEAPVALVCVRGKRCELSCLIEGVPSPSVSFTKNGIRLIVEAGQSDLELIKDSNYTHSSLLLIIKDTQLQDYGQYACNGTNTLNTTLMVTSNEVNLTVHSPATIRENPVNTVGNESFGASFTCSFDGIPAPSVSWFKRELDGSEVNIEHDGGKYDIQLSSRTEEATNLNIITSTLTIGDLNITDQLTYGCRGDNGVENVIGADDDGTASLIVHIPPTVVALNPFEVVINGSSNLRISFNITRAFPSVELTNIEWSFMYINESEITLDTTCAASTANCSDNDRYSRYNFSSDLLSLTIGSVRVADYGFFSLTATNQAGNSTQTANITVHVPPRVFTSGRVVDYNVSDNLSLSCMADGIPPPGIRWSYNSLAVDTLRPRTQLPPLVYTDAVRPSILTVPGDYGVESTIIVNSVVARSDAGSVVCIASNEAGQSELRPPYEVVITEVLRDPCESSPCANGGTCTALLEGDFLCKCASLENVEYGGPRCTEETDIKIKPEITQGPVDNFVNLFKRVDLKCIAIGQPTPVITWQKDGQDIKRTGDTLVISEVTLNDRANYTCTATNPYGKAVSRNAIVNTIDIIQYIANLTVRFDQVSGNLTIATLSVIEQINDKASQSKGISGGTFFSITSQGIPINNTRNITLPILVTIRLKDNIPNDKLRESVESAVSSFGFALQINADSGVRVFDRCSPEVTILPSPDGNSLLDFKLEWSSTVLGMTAELECPCELRLGSSVLLARRTCGGNFESGAVWNPPMDSMCDFSITARELCRLARLDDEALLFSLDNITRNTSALGSTELTITSALLNRTQSGASGNATLTNSASSTINNILRADRSSQVEGQITSGSQTRMLNAFQNMINTYPIPKGQSDVIVTMDLVAYRVGQVSPDQANFNSSELNPDIRPVFVQLGGLNNITNSSTNSTTAVYANDGLYIESGSEVISSVFDFSILNMDVNDLKNPIEFSFDVSMRERGVSSDDLDCVFWDIRLNKGNGGWSREGVSTTVDSDGKVICSTDHLTSFSVLLDVAADQTPPPAEDLAFTALTYIGISVSIVCILITLFTYIYSSKLRKSDANKLLINLCFALLGLYLTFFLASQGSKISTFVCAVVGALLHYFLLVVFFIMAAEAIDLFIKLVIVLGSTIQHYLTKAVIIAWILPLFIVPFTMAPNYGVYVNEHYCGATGPALYVGVLFPFLVVYIFNVTIFFIIMISLLKKSQAKSFGDAKKKNRKQETKQQCRVAFTISILFGLGWGFGLLASQAIGVAPIRIFFNAMFSILVCFQGFFIFLLYIVLSPNAKKEWRYWIFRKEHKGSEATSSVGSSSSRSTASTGVASSKKTTTYKGRHTNRRGGTLYHNVYSSQNKTDTSNVTTEFASDAFDTELQMMDELKFNLENNKNKTYANPLDEYEDTFSMLSGPDDTISIGEVAVSAFPNPKSPLSQNSDIIPGASLTADDDHDDDDDDLSRPGDFATLKNPLQSVRNKQVSIDVDEFGPLSSQESFNDNHVFAINLSDQFSESQGLSDGTFFDKKTLIKP